MSALERRGTSILIVEREPAELEGLRSALLALGYGATTASGDHDTALKMVYGRNYSHIIFTAQKTSITARDFISKAHEVDPKAIPVVTSWDPQVDEVFDLLRLGARGFIVKPFSIQSLDAAILFATKGDPFSQVILEAQDRNEAFSALLAATLDKLADTCAHSRKLSAPGAVIKHYQHEFSSVSRLARCFAKGGEEALLKRMVDFFVNLAEGPATRLGRLRKRLADKRREQT